MVFMEHIDFRGPTNCSSYSVNLEKKQVFPKSRVYLEAWSHAVVIKNPINQLVLDWLEYKPGLE